MWRAEDGNERSQKNTYQDNPEEILVEQSHRDSCDINFIMKKYEKTGQVQHVMDRMPNFGDFENIDYQSSLNAVIQAQDTFYVYASGTPEAFRKRSGKIPRIHSGPKKRIRNDQTRTCYRSPSSRRHPTGCRRLYQIHQGPKKEAFGYFRRLKRPIGQKSQTCEQTLDQQWSTKHEPTGT